MKRLRTTCASDQSQKVSSFWLGNLFVFIWIFKELFSVDRIFWLLLSFELSLDECTLLVLLGSCAEGTLVCSGVCLFCVLH